MRLVGIIAEYNPFHNGHAYHVRKSRELSGADCVVAVMSGSFVQRGDIAVCDKWSRAEMAVLGGVDLVVELPVLFSAQSAEFFSKGAVYLLEQLGADCIAFGTEEDDLTALKHTAAELNNPSEHYSKSLGEHLKNGVSFPAARAAALRDAGRPDVVGSPNNLLAVEYLRAVPDTMEPFSVKRRGSQHDGVGSASYVRSLIKNGEDISNYVPETTMEILRKCVEKGIAPNFIDALDQAIVSNIRTMPAEKLANIRDVSEGLEHRIKKASLSSVSFMELADTVKTKRYTHSRIRRILLNALLGITKDTENLMPQYIRVLAMNDSGKNILKRAKEISALPVITKAADANRYKMLEYDFLSTDIYSLAFKNKTMSTGNYDVTTSPIIIG